MRRICPDYYDSFRCKQGACRHACCTDWPVTVSLNEYYRLLGVDCSPELRGQLDMALHPLPKPTNEEYAYLAPRFDGECRLRAEDGRCLLQMESGESALPLVCRLYPRGIRDDVFPSAACANSCEALVELFIKRPEPITFSGFEGEQSADENANALLKRINIMQRRDLSLPERLRLLGQSMGVSLCGDILPDVPPGCFARLQTAAGDILDASSEAGNSVREYGSRARARLFGSGRGANIEEAHRRLVAARNEMEDKRPNWQILFEHLIANHMFFSRFGLNRLPGEDSWLSLAAIYIQLRLLCLGNPGCMTDDVLLADILAAAFRLISHTDSERLPALFIRQNGLEGDILRLIRL